MAINTGNGGFDINGSNITFDNVDEGDEGSPPVPIDHGDLSPQVTHKDIGENTKRTIGQYLGNATRVNDYPIDGDSQPLSITDPNGFPAPNHNQNSSKFADGAKGTTINQPDLNGSSRTISDPSVQMGIKKGRGSGTDPNGNSLLSGVGKNALTPALQKYMNVVMSNNRFTNASVNNDSQFVNGVITTTDDQRRVPLKPNSSYDPDFVHPKFGDISTGRLAQIGIALSLRGSGELDSAKAGNDPTSFGAQAKALLPSIPQAGLSRIDLKTLEAEDVLQGLTNSEIPENDVISIAPGGSWGALNNVFDQFSGINALGMIALAGTLTAGVFTIIEGLDFIINLINVGPKTLGKTTIGSYVKGRATLVPRSNPNAFPPDTLLDIGTLIGIRQTVNPFKRCVDAGVSAFFGVSNDGSIVSKVAGTVVNSTRSPGFNAVVARTIIRSGLLIIDKFKNIGGNPISVAQGILGVIDEIKSSKLIGAMNVFASLGDQLLNDENSSAEKVNIDPDQPAIRSRQDAEPDDAFANNVTKNRLSGGLKLAWASNRSPSSYINVDFTSGLASVPGFGAPRTGIGLQSDRAKVFHRLLTANDIQQRGGRIPYDSTNPDDVTVKNIEQKLEAEYVPFYFHDLRTNEIISFQAFLTGLSDSFQPNYEASSGFGRVDDVWTYRSTSRRISSGFYVAATSEEDFNDMWVKMNKLTTLVYPQFTKGRTLTTSSGNSRIIQPFSQLIGSSPIIRLRIGDVIRSNYSRFNLARLFGADHGDMILNQKAVNFAGLIDEIKKKLQEAIATKNETYTWLLQDDNLSISNNDGKSTINPPAVSIAGNAGASGAFAPTMQVDPQDLKFFEFRIVGKVEKGSKVRVVKPSITTASDISIRFGIDAKIAQQIVSSLTNKYDNTNSSSRRIVGGSYVLNSDNLLPTIKTINTIRDEVLSQQPSFENAVTELTDFMNPNKNAIVRSFQQTKGKGLAGKIDNLDFDFFEGVTWETSINQRAPKLIKVSFSFTPIHDIPPGLDHQGTNRGVIYPVGHNTLDNDEAKDAG